ncbi:DUF937 domain-containing protein [Methylocystis sp. 9N]|uniref:DUF937 domain-containing protein n=1 Tax=Methylocystis borbori TaxID=3118750 RepID=A0ABU7XEU1_9HYPH
MSNFDEILLSAQGGQLIANLAQRYGLSDEQAENAVRALAPALEIGLSRAVEHPQLFEKLIGELVSPQRGAAFYDAETAQGEASVAQSRAFLDDLFGSPAAAGQVVQAAARESGLRPDILSQLLPVLASVLLGGLFKNASNQGLGSILEQVVKSGALSQILGQILGGGAIGAPPREPEPAPPPLPRGGGGLGPLGGILGSILGSLLGGGRRQRPDDYGGPLGDAGGGIGRGGPAGLPEGLDQDSVQQAIEEIKKTLQVGRGGGVSPGAGESQSQSAGGRADLQDLLGQILGRR